MTDLTTEIINTATDFNTLISKEKYLINVGGCANSPTPNNGGQLFVSYNNDNIARQCFVSDVGEIFIRNGYGNSWHSWKDGGYAKRNLPFQTSSSTILNYIVNSGAQFGCMGFDNVSDAPDDGAYAVIWFGSSARIVVITTGFANNGKLYKRSIFGTDWYENQWYEM